MPLQAAAAWTRLHLRFLRICLGTRFFFFTLAKVRWKVAETLSVSAYTKSATASTRIASEARICHLCGRLVTPEHSKPHCAFRIYCDHASLLSDRVTVGHRAFDAVSLKRCVPATKRNDAKRYPTWSRAFIIEQ